MKPGYARRKRTAEHVSIRVSPEVANEDLIDTTSDYQTEVSIRVSPEVANEARRDIDDKIVNIGFNPS